MATRSIQLDYDLSNQTFYIWIIKLKIMNTVGPYLQTYEMAFRTRLEAMQILEQARDGEWKQTKDGFIVSLFPGNNFYNAFEAIVTNLVVINEV